VAVNCGAIPESLAETELLGAERGAFTDATSRPGCFERAASGTLFLDEIGELPRHAQATLLRVLEQKELVRIGGSRAVALDVRVVAATNRDLRAERERGAFREDLYWRLAVLTLKLPPLRERIDDLPLLAASLLASMGRADAALAPDAERLLRQHGWPGNVRELRNVLERALLTSGDGEIRARDLVFD
jgi:transcriptional regulator with PAS, ATPase and Fis domain